MRLLLIACALILGLALPAAADGPWQEMDVTSDNAVPSDSTEDFVIPGNQPANYVWIKNDCSADLYFSTAASQRKQYPIRLKQGEIFSGEITTFVIGASPAAGNSASCTFSLFLGRK